MPLACAALSSWLYLTCDVSRQVTPLWGVTVAPDGLLRGVTRAVSFPAVSRCSVVDVRDAVFAGGRHLGRKPPGHAVQCVELRPDGLPRRGDPRGVVQGICELYHTP